MQENTDQNNSEYVRFTRSDYFYHGWVRRKFSEEKTERKISEYFCSILCIRKKQTSNQKRPVFALIEKRRSGSTNAAVSNYYKLEKNDYK